MHAATRKNVGNMQMSDNQHRQIALNCHRLLQIAHITVQVENSGKLRWNLVDLESHDSKIIPPPNSAIFCHATIGSLITSTLAALKISVQALPIFPKRHTTYQVQLQSSLIDQSINLFY